MNKLQNSFINFDNTFLTFNNNLHINKHKQYKIITQIFKYHLP